jgi:hypothetical protein
MMQIWRGTIIVLGTLLAASACTANVGTSKRSEDVGVTRSALSDPLQTPFGAQTAIATNGDGNAVMVVWQANFSGTTGDPQIIGQAFNQNDGSPRITNPVSQQYSLNGGIGNTLPAVATEEASGLHEFLIVWERDYSATDEDILAQLVSDDGTPINQFPFVIENDDQPEKSPAVALIPDQDRWLVTYTRTDTNGVTSLMARWVDVFGNVVPDPNTSPALTLVSGGIHVPKGRSSISSCAGTNLAMITYNDNLVNFVTIPNLHVGTPFSVSGTGLVGACNDTIGQYAVTWLQGSGNGAKIGTRVFPPGCSSFSCATPTNYVVSAGSHGVNGLNLPVISAFGFNFGVGVGLLPTSLQTLDFMEVDSSNNALDATINMVSSCTGSTKGSLGNTDTLAASATDGDPTAREFFSYDPYCSNQHKVRAVGPNPDDILDQLSFDVSD